MRIRKEKLIARIVIFTVIIAIISIIVLKNVSFAKETTIDGITWEYTITSIGDTEVAMDLKPKDPTKLSGNITIPSKVDSYVVLAIADYAFYNLDITGVTIPETVAVIGEYAFQHCSNLANLDIKGESIIIGESAFYGCKNLVGNSSGTGLTIPGKLLFLGDEAFEDCKKLTSIKATVSEIGKKTFYGCSALKSATLTDVTTIGDYAFDGCSSLKSFNFSDKLTSIGAHAFEGSGLESITIPKNVETIGEAAFSECANLQIADIKANIKELPAKIFSSTPIKAVTIPDTVTSIGYQAFWGSDLESLDIPQGVISIGNNAFGSSELVNINIPSSVISIGEMAFLSCNKLNNLILPNSITSIGESAFELDNRDDFVVYYTPAISSVIDTYSGNFNNFVEMELSEIKVASAPEKVIYIEGENFNSNGMKIIATYKKDSVEASYLVKNYTVLDKNKLALGQANVTISYTEGNKTVTTTQNITTVEKKLTKIEVTKVPNKTAYVEGQSFDKTGMVVSATYDNGEVAEVKNYTITDGNNLAARKNSVEISYTEGDITVTTTQEIRVIEKEVAGIEITKEPNKLIYAEGQDFDMTGMEVTLIYNDGSRKITDNYEIIGRQHLSLARTSVTISYTEGNKTVTTTQSITVVIKDIEEIKITNPPDKTNYIEGENFDKTGMEVVAAYNDGTTEVITNYTVVDGKNLALGKTSVEIKWVSGNVTRTATQEIVVRRETIANGIAWLYCLENGKAVNVIPKSISDLPRNVDIPNSLDEYPVTNIGQLAFFPEEGTIRTIESVTIPDSVVSIGNGAFSCCYDLKKVVIGTGVENIGIAAFQECTSLNTIIIKSDRLGKLERGSLDTGTTTTVYYKKAVEDIVSSHIAAWTTISGARIKIDKIEITNPPTKTSYIAGQNFDKTGMIVTVTYNYGESKEIENYTVVDGENLTAGTTSVRISYTEDEVTENADQLITVEQEKLEGIGITNPPTKTNYIAGENFDKTGMIVTATYNNGKSKAIENYTIMDGDNLTAEKTRVVISYTENSITKIAYQAINVTVVSKELTKIEITNLPTKTSYVVGENFDKTGMVVTATYNDGTNKEIDNYEVIGGENLAEGTTSVTIRYTENGIQKEVTQEITVVAKELTKIEITNSPTKTSYVVGENFDKTGMVVTATYNDGTSKEIDSYEIIGGENLAEGTTSVTIRYTENGIQKEVTQKITVVAKKIVKIEITNPPTKTSYVVGENFDKTGMVVTATYNDGTSKEIDSYEIIGGENLAEGTTSVTIRYTENGILQEAIQKITVTVVAKELTKIEITNSPTKTSYVVGENFDKTGMVVKATYNDGTSKEIDSYEIIGGENLAEGTTSVTIRYTENGIQKEVTQKITVVAKKIVKIEITNSPTKTSYVVGENFDKTGMVVKATYNDGTSKEIDSYEIIGGENLTEGTTSVTIRYTENGVQKEATQSITVTAKDNNKTDDKGDNKADDNNDNKSSDNKSNDSKTQNKTQNSATSDKDYPKTGSESFTLPIVILAMFAIGTYIGYRKYKEF